MKTYFVRSKYFVVLIGLLFFNLFGFSADSSAAENMTQAEFYHQYDSIFPYYAEVCALHQVVRNKEFFLVGNGGTGGHSTMYLRGACLDFEYSYPRLKLCDESERYKSNTFGTGISVNGHFSNVNWVGMQDRTFFYWGAVKSSLPETQKKNLSPELIPFTGEVYEQSWRQAKARGLLRGVRLRPKHAEEFEQYRQANIAENPTYEDFGIQILMGTDYAMKAARGSSCVMVPMTRQMVVRAIEYVNQKNDRYQKEGAKYKWDLFTDNCAHLIHNALASAGIYKFKDPEVNAATVITMPSSEYLYPFQRHIEVSENLNQGRIDSMISDRRVMTNIRSEEWSPVQEGIVTNNLNLSSGEVFHQGHGLMFMVVPPFIDRLAEMKVIESTPAMTDLRANLKATRFNYLRWISAIEGEMEQMKLKGKSPLSREMIGRSEIVLYLKNRLIELDRKQAVINLNTDSY